MGKGTAAVTITSWGCSFVGGVRFYVDAICATVVFSGTHCDTTLLPISRVD